jgi:hypothetical protein
MKIQMQSMRLLSLSAESCFCQQLGNGIIAVQQCTIRSKMLKTSSSCTMFWSSCCDQRLKPQRWSCYWFCDATSHFLATESRPTTTTTSDVKADKPKNNALLTVVFKLGIMNVLIIVYYEMKTATRDVNGNVIG